MKLGLGMIVVLWFWGRVVLTNDRKDSLAVIGRLLTAIKNNPDSAFSKQWAAANLNTTKAHLLIDGLLVCRYVCFSERLSKQGNTQYNITKKGRGFLSKIVECYMRLDDVEFSYENIVKVKERKILEEIIE